MKSKKPPLPPKKLPIPLEVAEDGEAKLEWIRVVQALADKVDRRDISLLTDYCLTHSEIKELRLSVATEGRTLEGPKGGMYINPTVNLLISRQSHISQLRRDLYFTPKSRIEKQSKTAAKGNSIRDSILNSMDEE